MYKDTYENTSKEIPTKELTNLTKLYYSDDSKYRGEMYDVLNTKLQIFYDYYNKAGIRQQHYYYAFSIILKGRASTFYYDYI